MISTSVLTRLAIPFAAVSAAAAFLTLGALGLKAEQQSGSYAFPIQITSVEVRVRESYPVQLALDVEGVIPDGCSRFEQAVQWRDGNQIVVRMLARHSGADICTMIAQVYRDTIVLDGPLPRRDYVVDVNGAVHQLRVD